MLLQIANLCPHLPGHKGIEGNETIEEMERRVFCTRLKDLNPPMASLTEL
jgi:hypothetical protein